MIGRVTLQVGGRTPLGQSQFPACWVTLPLSEATWSLCWVPCCLTSFNQIAQSSEDPSPEQVLLLGVGSYHWEFLGCCPKQVVSPETALLSTGYAGSQEVFYVRLDRSFPC